MSASRVPPNASSRPAAVCRSTTRRRASGCAALLVAAGLGAACQPAPLDGEVSGEATRSTEGSGALGRAAGGADRVAAVAPPTPAGLLLRGTFIAAAEESTPVRTGISWDGEHLAWLANGQAMRQDQCRIVDETDQDVTLSCLQADGTTTTHQWVLLDNDRVVHAVTPAVVLVRMAPAPDVPPQSP